MLNQDIMYLPGVGPLRKKLLEKEIGVTTYGQLLEYFPYKYVDRSRFYMIAEMTEDMPFVQVRGRILSFESFEMGRAKTRVVAHFTDGRHVMDLVWFNGGKYAMKTYKPRTDYIVFGKPALYNGRMQITHPEIETTPPTSPQGEAEVPLEGGFRGVYITTERMKKAGMTSRQMEKLTRTLVKQLQGKIAETLPEFMIQSLGLMPREQALIAVHYPLDHVQLEEARRRLKFEELFFVQLNIVRYVSNRKNKFQGYIYNKVGDCFNGFYRNHLPFELTGAQKRVMREIREDTRSGRQMNRLLQGDVGSGKTLVALMTMLLAIDNGFQACMMAPTEILAEQHFDTITQMLRNLYHTDVEVLSHTDSTDSTDFYDAENKKESVEPAESVCKENTTVCQRLRVELLTGMVKGKRREKILSDLAAGEIDILIGTHAVIEPTVVFGRLGMVVVDEQHRFGVEQRAKLWNKSERPPHVLVMTATPIPRTLAMTLYGDLDVSVIDELPPGRKPIVTNHISDTSITSLYDGIRKQINLGRQVYIVFPLIEESAKIDLKNLDDGYESLRQIFPEFRLSKVHGKMKPQEKDEEMRRFVSGETQILVATTVIEVGVNVPNASVMVVMEAQRFGLSQLHQLRGRVGRGADQSYCILVHKPELSKETRTRIDIMCQTNDGFRIAEADLKLRGPGDLEGTQQSGMAFDLKIANIAQDGILVQMAREEAQRIIDDDPLCQKPMYSLLWNRLRELRKTDINWSAIS